MESGRLKLANTQDFKHIAIMADELGMRVGQFLENVRARKSIKIGHNVDLYYMEDETLYEESKAYYKEWEDSGRL
jgi:hypothetical protein